MKKIISGILLLLSTTGIAFGQCASSTDGQNLIVNGDFSLGSTGFTSGYAPHCLSCVGGSSGCDNRDAHFTGYSNAGEYCVTNDVYNNFHCCLPNFNGTITHTFTDHSPSADNLALFVDGNSVPGVDIWCQTVNVLPATNYYFTAFIATLFYDGDPDKLGKIRFKINGVQVGPTITSPTTNGTWNSYTQVWSSGAMSGPISICITNDNTAATGNDFVIDDIAFTSGCAYGAPGPVPLLNAGAASVSLCGNPSGVTLTSGVTGTALEFVWREGASVITGAGADSYVATTPGVYTVCTRETFPTASCWRSDEILVTDTYGVDLGSDASLCSPPSLTLNAGHTGTGVTYVWTKDGAVIPGAVSLSYTATSAGVYAVEVTDPLCGTRTDEITISSNMTASPNDNIFCTVPSVVDLSVTAGAGIFNWYDVPTGGSILPGGSNTTTFTTPPISVTTTYYVEDATLTDYSHVGPDNDHDGYVNGGVDRKNDTYTSGTPAYIEFETYKDGLGMKEMTVNAYCEGAPCNGSLKIAFYTTAGVLVAESADIPINIVANYSYVPVVLPVNVTLASMGIYRVSIKDVTPSKLKFGANRYLSPPCNFSAYNEAAGTLSFRTAQIESTGHCGWPYLYDWKIGSPGGCGRVLVNAIRDCSLPVQFMSFEATLLSGSTGYLHWITLEEKDTDYFQIERSDDGINFFPVGTMKAGGNSDALLEYSFYDPSPVQGTVYYRIAEYDKDGEVSYSVIRSLKPFQETSFEIRPNPGKGIYTWSATVLKGQPVSLSVLNVLGEIVYERTEEAPADYYTQTFSIEDKAAGMYYVYLTVQDQKICRKIIKQ